MTDTQPFRGVIAPILTPFDEDLAIAGDLFLANARRCLDAGCVALAPFGTTGEALSLGIDERMEALEDLVAGGIPADRLIPGTGLTSLPDTVRLTRHAVGLGCAGTMVLPPFFYKEVPEDGLYAHFARLVDAVDDPRLRLYLYHIPQVSGVGFPVGLVRRLVEDFPGIVVGIKDSSGAWQNTEELLGVEGLIVYPGSELPLLEAMARGAPGCVSATANLNAAAIAEVIRLWQAGEREAAARRHEAVRTLRLIVQGYAPIQAQKRLLALATGDARWAGTRPPLLPMPEAEGRALARRLEGELAFRLAA